MAPQQPREGETLTEGNVCIIPAHSVLTADQREKLRNHLVSSGHPWYVTDQQYPGKIIEVHPDGSEW
jgi:hypothetical protein